MSLSLLGAHCAARSPAPTSAQLADLARADALVREGCYRCLQEAYGVYSRVIDPPKRRSPDRARRGAFDVTLLLAVREKEMGLPADASLARARAMLSSLSRAATSATEQLAARLDAAEAILGDMSGLDTEERRQRDERLQPPLAPPAIERLQGALRQSVGTDLVAAYFSLALDCEQPANRRSLALASVVTRQDTPPLMHYRAAICSMGPPTALTELRVADPRWTDAFFFEGKYEMGSPARSPEPVRAASLLASAAEAFPRSIAIHVLLAKAQEMNGDFAGALATVEKILVLNPAHVDARLGRVRNLTYLGRAEEGIAAATSLIELGTWHVGDAYYWRAWNQYQAHRLESAWSDVQKAMQLVANTSVYALAGSIAYARRELDTAVSHFDSAFTMDSTNCVAASSAGLVHIDRGAWQPAADRFSKATNCYSLAASTVRAELATLEASALDPAIKAGRLSSAKKRLESAEALGGRSALNAAQSYVSGGERALALSYIERAERDPNTRDEARALKARIAGIERP